MKLFLLFILAIADVKAGIFDGGRINRPSLPICKDGKASQSYSLTMYAYNGVEAGISLEAAGEKLVGLAADYDFLAKKLLPSLLLNSIIFQTDDTYSSNMITLSQGFIRPRRVDNNPDIDHLSFVPASAKGDELVVCPKTSCAGLVVSGINKTIVQKIDGVSRKRGYEIKENPYDDISGDHTPSDFRSLHFLYDVISKSGLGLGDFFKNNYFVIPDIEQDAICKDIKTRLPDFPNAPDGCFKNRFSNDFTDQERKSSFKMSTHLRYLLSSQKNTCTKSKEGAPCQATDMQKMSYMDAVARDYAEQVMFNIEKKNEGKWTIYHIKLNPEFICKYGRPKSELVTK